jgi:hypothetical protein
MIINIGSLALFLVSVCFADEASAQNFDDLSGRCSAPVEGASVLDLYFEPCEIQHLDEFNFDEFAYQSCFARRSELRQALKSKPACVEVDLSLGPYDFARKTFPVHWSGWLMGDPQNLGAWLTEGVPSFTKDGAKLATAREFLVRVEKVELAKQLRHSAVRAQCVVDLKGFYLLDRVGAKGMSARFEARLDALKKRGTISAEQHTVALGEIGDLDTAQGGVGATIQACRVVAETKESRVMLHHWPATVSHGSDLSFPKVSLLPSKGAILRAPTDPPGILSPGRAHMK